MPNSINELIKNAEIQVRENAALLQQLQEKMVMMAAIVESTDEAIISKTLDGIIKSWNPGSEKMYGYTALEAIGQNIDLIIPEQYIAQKNKVSQQIRSNQTIHFDTIRKNKNGEQFDVSITETPMHDFSGAVTGTSSIARNISEQKNLQRKLTDLNINLEESSEHFYAIFDFNPMPMLMSMYDTGKIQNVNKSFLQLFGYSKEEVIGKTAVELNIYDADTLEEIIEVLQEHSHIKNIEVAKKDGEQIWVIPTAQLIKLNETAYILASFQDVSESKRAEQIVKEKTIQLEQQNAELNRLNTKLQRQIKEKEMVTNELKNTNLDVKELHNLADHKESILAVLSHDLRSPLNGIIGMADYLKNDFEEMDRGEVRHIISLLDESAKRELTMLDNLLEWARIKYASDAFRPENIMLAQYVQQAIDTLFDTALMYDINIVNQIEAHTTVYADKKMLQSILQNVLSNAVNYSEPQGEIFISAMSNGEKIMIEVKGHNMQLSKTVINKLFSPDIKPLAEAKKGNSGAGIGLLLVRGFLEKNNGSLWIESSKGRGSSFYFTLPLNKPLVNTENK